MITIDCRCEVVEIKRKTRAEMLCNVRKGDVLRFELPLVGRGRSSRGPYAALVSIINERTGENRRVTLNEWNTLGQAFELKRIDKGE